MKCYGSTDGSNPSSVGSTPTTDANLYTEYELHSVTKLWLTFIANHGKIQKSTEGNTPVARKTIAVAEFKDTINDYLATSVCSADVRQGMIEALTTVLHSTGNYKGFHYLLEHDIPVGQKPGIHWVDNKPDFTDTDRTRVCYS